MINLSRAAFVSLAGVICAAWNLQVLAQDVSVSSGVAYDLLYTDEHYGMLGLGASISFFIDHHSTQFRVSASRTGVRKEHTAAEYDEELTHMVLGLSFLRSFGLSGSTDLLVGPEICWSKLVRM